MQIEIIQKLIELGLSLKQISEKLICSKTTARYWIKKFDLKLKRGSRGKKPKDFTFPRKCSCGEDDPDKFYGNKTKICAKCHSKANLDKGHENRVYILQKLGGRCSNVKCGFDKYSSALDMHHIDPSHKDVAFKTIRYWSRAKIDEELKKCILLCKNCHAAHHSGVDNIYFL